MQHNNCGTVSEHIGERCYTQIVLSRNTFLAAAAAISRLVRHRNLAVYGGVNVINVSRDDDTIWDVRNLRIPFNRDRVVGAFIRRYDLLILFHTYWINSTVTGCAPQSFITTPGFRVSDNVFTENIPKRLTP